MRYVLTCVSCFIVAASAYAEEKPYLGLDTGGHNARIGSILFTPDGEQLISVSYDKTIRIWSTASGEPLRTLHPPIGPKFEGMLFAAAITPDGNTLAVGGFGNPNDKWGNIYIISLATGRVERVLKGHSDVIIDLAFAPDNIHLASACVDQTARIWNIQTGVVEHVLKGHTNRIQGIAMSPDGRKVATVAYDKTARIWSVATGKIEAVLEGHTMEVQSVAWSPDGRTLATGSLDQSIRLWSPDGKLRKKYDGLESGIMALTFTNDSRQLLYSLGAVTTIYTSNFIDLASGKKRLSFGKHQNSITHRAISPDGKLAATSDALGEIFLWNTQDAKVVYRLAGKGRTNWAAGWSQDGKTVAWGDEWKGGDEFQATTAMELTFRLADLDFGEAPDQSFNRAHLTYGGKTLEKTSRITIAVKEGGQTVAELKMREEYNYIRCATFMPNDRVAVGGEFGLFLYNSKTGAELRDFKGHTGIVMGVALSPDNRYLLSASSDQTLRIWDPNRDDPLLSMFFSGSDWIAWTPEGYYAASPGGESLIGWHVNNGSDEMASFYPATQFRKSLYKPELIKKILDYGSVEKALAMVDPTQGRKGVQTNVSKVLPPKVTIQSPAKSGLHIQKPELEIRASAQSVGNHPVTALRLLVDGRPYQGQTSYKKVSNPKLGEVRETWSVELTPGKHDLAVQAESEVSAGLSNPVVVEYIGESQTEQVELPNLYILAIGVSAYPGDLKLNYAAKDAEAIAKTFQEKSKPLFHRVDVKLLEDKGATRAEILKGMTWLRKEITQKDYSIVFFSGHGESDADGSLYLLPVDVDVSDLLSTGVPAHQIKTTLASLPGKIIFMMDACHAGAVDTVKRKAAKSLTDDLVRDLVTDESGVVAMCSSTGREFSLENNEHRQGNFTLAIIEGLSGKASKSADGAIYLHHLDSYVTDRVKELSHGQQHPVTSRPASVRSFPLAKP